ncbi:MAG: hypothetical protein MUC73_09540 [Cyclobacteriaceae bacterium]|jgi:hypothetical protein|nr:hypothetical protein [Cyclobacteriaceae bacterium]
MVIAINIETGLWNRIIEHFVGKGWAVTYKYDNYDAGIDSDFVILEKEGEEILFGWDNWFEGEIQCNPNLLNELEEIMNIKFQHGEPTNLKPGVIELHRKWKGENRWNRTNS